jgi:hypothetical protein
MKVKTPKRSASKSRKPDDPEQFARFIETAQKLGVDDSPGALDRAFDKVIQPKRPTHHD